jgi:hypothetical protein
MRLPMTKEGSAISGRVPPAVATALLRLVPQGRSAAGRDR